MVNALGHGGFAASYISRESCKSNIRMNAPPSPSPYIIFFKRLRYQLDPEVEWLNLAVIHIYISIFQAIAIDIYKVDFKLVCSILKHVLNKMLKKSLQI